MVYILIMTLIIGNRPTSYTVEFKSKTECDSAKKGLIEIYNKVYIENHIAICLEKSKL